MNDASDNCKPGEAPEKFWAEAEALAGALLAQMEYFMALGVTAWPLPPPAAVVEPAPAARPIPESERPPAAGRRPRLAEKGPGQPDFSAAPSLEALSAMASAIPGRQAAFGANRTFGRGAGNPIIVFVGPNPGLHDGDCGALLRAMIEKGMKLSAADYYVTSVCKCAPNDDDAPDAACLTILKRELTLLNPKIVLALGQTTGRILSGRPQAPLGLLRSSTHVVKSLPAAWLRVTYDLEDILSSPAIKKEAWKDLQRIMAVVGKIKES
ncbi:MAG: hypothetical protein LBS31_11570 [Candidatus Adiutrix sp.]|jgi:uracil-DNA glycosylase family 4|nr:hypothetical protein [Candidatus Adiutrix sp.]